MHVCACLLCAAQFSAAMRKNRAKKEGRRKIGALIGVKVKTSRGEHHPATMGGEPPDDASYMGVFRPGFQ